MENQRLPDTTNSKPTIVTNVYTPASWANFELKYENLGYNLSAEKLLNEIIAIRQLVRMQ